MVWSLIFLEFGVDLVNAEEQGIQVQHRMSEQKDLYQTPRMEDDASLETCESGNIN